MSLPVNQLINVQIFETFIMFFSGFTFMLCLETFNFLKKKVLPRKYIAFVLDLIFWLFAALLTVAFLNYAAFGRLSVHVFIAFAVGLILWRKCFYGIIDKN